jgi:hypothetical protein
MRSGTDHSRLAALGPTKAVIVPAKRSHKWPHGAYSSLRGFASNVEVKSVLHELHDCHSADIGDLQHQGRK